MASLQPELLPVITEDNQSILDPTRETFLRGQSQERLAGSKSFLRWCCARKKWIPRNPLDEVSRDPQFDEKTTDVVGLYVNPPENAIVLSVDEKTSVQALERTQPMLPLTEGQIERHTHDYKRNGVIDLYAALEIATGVVTGQCTDTHTGADFLTFMKKVASEYPKKDLHVIVDNSSAHKTPDVLAWNALNPRVTFHFTPTSASWLNETPPRLPGELEHEPEAIRLDEDGAHHRPRPPQDACPYLAGGAVAVENGVSAHVEAASLGHESSRTTMQSDVSPKRGGGSAAADDDGAGGRQARLQIDFQEEKTK